jgi:hypothetical protein
VQQNQFLEHFGIEKSKMKGNVGQKQRGLHLETIKSYSYGSENIIPCVTMKIFEKSVNVSDHVLDWLYA